MYMFIVIKKRVYLSIGVDVRNHPDVLFLQKHTGLM